MSLQLASLARAVGALKRAVASADGNLDGLSADLRDTVRAGVVQHFEVAYEQCWKFMQRWLRENHAAEEASYPRTRKELFRLAARYGLISDPLPWFDFAEARNLTTHTYDPARAAEVYQTARRFLPHAEELLRHLEAKCD